MHGFYRIPPLAGASAGILERNSLLPGSIGWLFTRRCAAKLGSLSAGRLSVPVAEVRHLGIRKTLECVR